MAIYGNTNFNDGTGTVELVPDGRANSAWISLLLAILDAGRSHLRLFVAVVRA